MCVHDVTSQTVTLDQIVTIRFLIFINPAFTLVYQVWQSIKTGELLYAAKVFRFVW